MQEELNFCGKEETGNRQNTKDDFPTQNKGKIHFSLVFRSMEFQKLHVPPHSGDGVHISAAY